MCVYIKILLSFYFFDLNVFKLSVLKISLWVWLICSKKKVLYFFLRFLIFSAEKQNFVYHNRMAGYEGAEGKAEGKFC